MFFSKFFPYHSVHYTAHFLVKKKLSCTLPSAFHLQLYKNKALFSVSPTEAFKSVLQPSEL